jgi:hypothetical protein
MCVLVFTYDFEHVLIYLQICVRVCMYVYTKCVCVCVFSYVRMILNMWLIHLQICTYDASVYVCVCVQLQKKLLAGFEHVANSSCEDMYVRRECVREHTRDEKATQSHHKQTKHMHLLCYACVLFVLHRCCRIMF